MPISIWQTFQDLTQGILPTFAGLVSKQVFSWQLLRTHCLKKQWRVQLRNAVKIAKVIKEFRKKSNKPLLKGAYIQESIYVGDNQLDSLVELKSKDELIGEIIGLLQSPAKNVVSALKSSGGKLAGIVKTLSEREG